MNLHCTFHDDNQRCRHRQDVQSLFRCGQSRTHHRISPVHAIDELVEAVAQIATNFKTKWYGGKCGVLTLIVSKDEVCRVTNDNASDCSRAVETALQNPRITLSALPDD